MRIFFTSCTHLLTRNQEKKFESVSSKNSETVSRLTLNLLAAPLNALRDTPSDSRERLKLFY